MRRGQRFQYARLKAETIFVQAKGRVILFRWQWLFAMPLTATLRVLGTVLLAVVPSHGAGQSTEQLNFQIEIHTATDKGPRFTITNHSQKTLTACYVEIFSSSENRVPLGMAWDAFSQGRSEQPLEPGASTSMPLSHVVGGPMPDKVQISAGVWADGDTFGRAELVQILLKGRVLRENEYIEAISLLQEGIGRSWSREQYLATLSEKKITGPLYSIRSTLEANKNLDPKRSLRIVVQKLLEGFIRQREILGEAKPHKATVAGP